MAIILGVNNVYINFCLFKEIHGIQRVLKDDLLRLHKTLTIANRPITCMFIELMRLLLILHEVNLFQQVYNQKVLWLLFARTMICSFLVSVETRQKIYLWCLVIGTSRQKTCYQSNVCKWV